MRPDSRGHVDNLDVIKETQMKAKLLLLMLLIELGGCGSSPRTKLLTATKSYNMMASSLLELQKQGEFTESETGAIKAAVANGLVYLTDWSDAIDECEDPNRVGPCPKYNHAKQSLDSVLAVLSQYYLSPGDKP